MTTPDTSVPSDPEENAPSQEFARALAEFETGGAREPKLESVPSGVARRLERGDKVHGRVVSIGEGHALIDHGGRSEATADLRHFRREDGSLKIAVGDELDLFVVKADDQVELGPTVSGSGDRHGPVQAIREAHGSGMPVQGRVTGVNSGGLEIDVMGVRAFCPISHVDVGFVTDPSVYVGRTLDFLITKPGGARGGVVLSRRQLLHRERQEEAKRALASLQPGVELEGRVARMEPFGAFVDLGGVDGLIHVSEIGHERLSHPKERLTEGQTVRVKVLSVTGEGGTKPRIALSMKALLPDPWTGIEERFRPGMKIKGTVRRLTDFGAFVAIAPGVEGLVHVSEAGLGHVKHVRDVLAAGDEVEVVVLAVDPARKRVGLSVRQALGGERAEPEGRPHQRRHRGSREGAGRSGSGRGAPTPTPPPQPQGGTELTPMAIALRKAMAKAKERAENEDTSS